MDGSVVLPVVLAVAVAAMIVVFFRASRSDRQGRSLERAEREGLLGAEGLRHAEERANADWVRDTSPGDTNSIHTVIGHTIADGARSHPKR